MLRMRPALRHILPLIKPTPPQTKPCPHPRLLSASSDTHPNIPSEASIVCDLRRGDFESGVHRFCKRPRSMRSNALHETLILAVAQVPDAVAAEAVLRDMPHPTPSAVYSVVNALCRERNVSAAIDVLEKTPRWGIPLDSRILATVTRAVSAIPPEHRERQTRRLAMLSSGVKLSRNAAPPMYTASAAEFFVDDGGDGAAWLRGIERRAEEGPESRSRRSVKKIMDAEAALLAARGDVNRVTELWTRMQNNPRLRGEVGVLAATVSSLVSAGWYGGARSLNVLMTWVQEHLYDCRTGRGKPYYTENASAMALLITSASKAIAASARQAPQMALAAFDALWAMRLPGFLTSLPLSGAYFKVLQHAGLSLEETEKRIDDVRQHHIQLDEQGFSMALGAILRCDERVVDKLAGGKRWLAKMRQAGIPLTVQTYNLFAGQLRYCNDPGLVSTLLSDMTAAGVVPTPVTYGLVFSACVIPGEYSSPSRKNALPVGMWASVLDAMRDHMVSSGVGHTANSRLSLARAYAHLGLTDSAMEEFEMFLNQRHRADARTATLRKEVEDAYCQMMFNFAHCREGSQDGPEMTMILHNRLRTSGFPVLDYAIDSVIVACVRKGQSKRALDYAVESLTDNPNVKLSLPGLKHLLMAHVEVCDPTYWERSRRLLVNARDQLGTIPLGPTVEKVVMAFARKQCREVCEDIMSMTGVEMRDLDYVAQGREFTRFRGRLPLESREAERGEMLTGGEKQNGRLEASDPHSSSIRAADLAGASEGSVLPLV